MGKIKNIAQLLKKYNSYKITKEELRRILKNEPFGRVTGIIGPYVLRYHNDKLIISRRSVIYNASQTAQSAQNRGKFAAESRFAGALNKIPAIKKIWIQSDLKGITAYHKLLKFNQIQCGHPSGRNSITPLKPQIHIGEICKLSEDLRIKIKKNDGFNTNYQLIVVFVPFEPVKKSDAPFEVIPVCCSYPQQGGELKFNEEQIHVIRRYKKYILYSAVVRENGKFCEWSNTSADEGRIISEDEIAGIIFLLALIYLFRKAAQGFQLQLRLLPNARDK